MRNEKNSNWTHLRMCHLQNSYSNDFCTRNDMWTWTRTVCSWKIGENTFIVQFDVIQNGFTELLCFHSEVNAFYDRKRYSANASTAKNGTRTKCLDHRTGHNDMICGRAPSKCQTWAILCSHVYWYAWGMESCASKRKRKSIQTHIKRIKEKFQ